MRALTVETTRLLWRTRGAHWDYEFICVPEAPELPGWFSALTEMLGDEDIRGQELRYGLLDIEGAGAFPWVGARFLDPARKDFAGRAIKHYAVWFPPLGADELDALPSRVPADWHLQVLKALAATYGGGAAFGLDEAAVRAWRKTHDESLAAAVTRLVKATPPIPLAPSDAAPSPWKRVGPVKKKTSAPRPLARSSPSPSPTRTFAAVVGIAAVVLLTLLQWMR